MKKNEVLITGAGGEVGHGLIRHLSDSGSYSVVAIDLNPLDDELRKRCTACYQGDLLDDNLISTIGEEHAFEKVFHLAGLLSTGSEKNPIKGHDVNVNASLNVLDLARLHAEILGKPVTFFFPSSIAAYGVDKESKSTARPVKEQEYLTPITMYGCNKLYVEQLGRYFSSHFKLLDTTARTKIDFRSLRFPGIISTDTLPSSGTSDYFPEMVHAAARGAPYTCFVRPDSTIPFMVMPDAVKAILELVAAPKDKLSTHVYNVTSFSISAEQIRSAVLKQFPRAEISFDPGTRRQRIVDSWPAAMDDSCARTDWGWKPEYGMEEAFTKYIFPGVAKRYAGAEEKKSS